MINTCRTCGGWFESSVLNDAIKNNIPFISCRYCGNSHEVGTLRSTDIDEGFKCLRIGNFEKAGWYFSTAIDTAKHHEHRASCEAYIGAALAQANVQVIFDEEDNDRNLPPTLICYKYSEEDFADNENYLHAIESVRAELTDVFLYEELEKLNYYQKYIDDVREAYRNIKGPDHYDVFIAYEDDPLCFNIEEYRLACTIRNSFPDEIKRVFLPDIDEYTVSDERQTMINYEAAILYAIEKSNCMLVIADSDIDSRLMNTYTRFYITSRTNKSGMNDSVRNLGFIRCANKVNINLPDRAIAEHNVFDVEDSRRYNKFVCDMNRVVYFDDTAPDEPEKNAPDTDIGVIGEIELAPDDGKPYCFVSNRQIAFGRYPQRRERSTEVENYFKQLGTPTMTSNNGWNVLFEGKTKKPYTWYRDEMIDGKLYRAIYFTKYRDVYSVQNSDIRALNLQKANDYKPLRIYCFAFQPLIWNVQQMSLDMATLVSEKGIDSVEYNNESLSNDWDDATLRTWLNSDFFTTAFTEEEREYMGKIHGSEFDERVYLVDEKMDSKFRKNNNSIIPASDYFKCIGGMCTSGINSFWIKSGDCKNGKHASVIFPGSGDNISSQFVDCTNVAVIPKIILSFM